MPDKVVRDLMHRGVIACKPDAPISEVVRIVSDTDVHAIVVLDENNRAVGMISHMEIIRLFDEDLTIHTAQEVMTSPVIDIEPHEPIKKAVALILEKGIHRLLVVEVEGQGRRPVGIVSTTDLVKEMHGSRWVWYMG